MLIPVRYVLIRKCTKYNTAVDVVPQEGERKTNVMPYFTETIDC